MNENDREMDIREEYDFSEARRGPIIPLMPGKTRISIRLDNDILQWFKAQVEGGGNYQTLINYVLRDYIARTELEARGRLRLRSKNPQGIAAEGGQIDPMRELIREVVREELARAK